MQTTRPTIAAIVLAKNEEEMLVNCLDALRWCDEIIVVDLGSHDATIDLAEKNGAHVFQTSVLSFAQRRNLPLSQIKTDWVIYIDPDERVTPQLSKEILVHIETSSSDALSFRRQNMMYGKFFEHGGWQNEVVTRVFRRSAFKGWSGDIHESPNFQGDSILLHTPLLHFTHRNVIDGLKKSAEWTPIEAKLLADAPVAPVTFFTLVRKGVMEFIRRAIMKNGKSDGMEGFIESLIQGINRIFVYMQVWELQQKPSLAEKYKEQEQTVAELWRQEKSK